LVVEASVAVSPPSATLAVTVRSEVLRLAVAGEREAGKLRRRQREGAAGRVIVEQDDGPIAGMNQDDRHIGDRREVDLDNAGGCNADRLVGIRLGQPNKIYGR
jgi:hypothetical protein